ncbi:MAG: peptide chain release factor N(5)-glutamine methyltransferase [Pseudomonadales bacterium]|nr:peptide chain release factor N(5)-glutamine methyltransferase [Pseudomonadales bacterium]
MSETISDLIERYSGTLTHISDTPQLDCQLLLTHALTKGRDWLFTHSDDTLDGQTQTRFVELVKRRQKGEPVAYLTGSKGFWNREFQVTPATLIPRPETELLIEILLERFDESPRSVIDLGTGTGAIAISLAAERSAWQVHAVDIDEDAVRIAQNNAADLDNIDISQGDWFDGIEGSFDMIVSNPPYIAAGDSHLESLRHEPLRALASGAEGLDDIRMIVSKAQEFLAEKGVLLLEHGYDQQEAIVTLLEEANFKHIERFKDLQGLPRAVMAQSPRDSTA